SFVARSTMPSRATRMFIKIPLTALARVAPRRSDQQIAGHPLAAFLHDVCRAPKRFGRIHFSGCARAPSVEGDPMSFTGRTLRTIAGRLPATLLRPLGAAVAVFFHGVERCPFDTDLQDNHHRTEDFCEIASALKAHFDV